MKLLNFKSMRSRLIYWFLVLALVPLMSALVIAFFQRTSAIEQSTIDKLTAIRDLKVIRLEGWIAQRIADVNTISGDQELMNLEAIIHKSTYNNDDLKILKNCRNLLNRFLVNNPDYYEFFIVNPVNGEILVSTNEYMERDDRSTHDYFKNPIISDQIYFEDIYYSKTLAELTMTFSKPIYSNSFPNKEIVGVLVAHVNLNSSLYKLLLERVGLGETGETLIVNKEGVALNQLRWFDNAPLNLHITAEPAVKASQGKTGIAKTKDYRGEEVFAAYTYIHETKWGFVCKQDMKELNTTIREMTWNFMLIFLIALFIIYFIALSISRTISKPIAEMSTVAKKIKSGDITARNTISTEDEMGNLATEFNAMAEVIDSKFKVQKGTAGISDIIIEQTTMNDFGKELLLKFQELTEANMAVFYVLNELSSEFEPLESIGVNEELLKPFRAENPQGELGNVLSTKEIYYLQNIPENSKFTYRTTAGDISPKEIISFPILIDDTVVAIISLVNIREFSKESYEIIDLSWNVINTSYSNLLSSERTRIFADLIGKTNQQLEAQAEELQATSEELQSQSEELQQSSNELQIQNVELEAQKYQVEVANKMKTEFLSNMSHELRTPLNSIMALSRVLIMQANSKLDEDENSYLEIIERNGKRLLTLINDILDLSKIEAGKMEVIPELISVGNLIEIIKENTQPIALQKGIQLTLSNTENLPKVETDEAKLHQVLLNVIGNAVKFTETGSVDISAQANSENVIIQIKDSGIGISEEMLPHIFEEFRQADGTSSRRFEGTGLGLAIAKKLISILGGSITVESKLNEGSVFVISVPIQWNQPNFNYHNIQIKNSTSERNQSSLISKEEKNIESIEPSKAIIQNNAKRILMVEDNPDAVIQIKTLLEQEHFVVDVAPGGQEALDYIQHTIPDGIILDLMMPNINGFDVLNKIRSTPRTQKIPVLILTAKDLTKAELAELTYNNIQQLIQKGDVDSKDLISKIKLLLKNEPPVIQKNQNIIELGNTLLQIENKTLNPNIINNEPTILIVEDNPDNMTTVQAILKGHYNFIEAFDGAAGLKLAQNRAVDLILLDMSLPIMSGEEFIKQLKINDETSSTPIVALTAQAMKGDKEKFLNLGCDGYVSKPIDHNELLEEIEKLIN